MLPGHISELSAHNIKGEGRKFDKSTEHFLLLPEEENNDQFEKIRA